MKPNLFATAISSLCLFFSVAAYAVPPTDFDSDGTSDQVYVSIASGSGALSWSTTTSATAGTAALGDIGVVGNHLILGHWEGGAVPQVGVIQSDGIDTVTWSVLKSDQSTVSLTQGKPSDLFLAGGDFDSSGAVDMASARKGKKKWVWTVRFNPFAGSSSEATVNFGAAKGTPFFCNDLGTGDRLAIVEEVKVRGRSRSQVTIRGVSSAQIRKFYLSSFAKSAGRPHPVRLSSGTDALVFVSQGASASKILVLSPQGRRILKATIALTGTVVVGDFISGGHEEILINGGEGTGTILALDGTQTSVVVPSGVPVDEININSFSSGSTPAPGQCTNGDPTDGSGGFVWKPRSDTQRFAVAVLPGRFTGSLSSVELETGSGTLIESLRDKGTGNPDTGGPRSSWISRSLTGQDLKNTYGEIVVKANFTDSSCVRYTLSNPARRYD